MISVTRNLNLVKDYLNEYQILLCYWLPSSFIANIPWFFISSAKEYAICCIKIIPVLHTHTRTHTYTPTHLHTCPSTHTQTHPHPHTHTHRHTSMDAHIKKKIQACGNAFIYIIIQNLANNATITTVINFWIIFWIRHSNSLYTLYKILTTGPLFTVATISPMKP